MMDDDTNEGLKWRVWFGGDVQGLDSLMPDIVCLHSLKSEEAKEASVTVMKDIQVSVHSFYTIIYVLSCKHMLCSHSLIGSHLKVYMILEITVDIVCQCKETGTKGSCIRA